MKVKNIILYEKAAIASSLIFTSLGIIGVRNFFDLQRMDHIIKEWDLKLDETEP